MTNRIKYEIMNTIEFDNYRVLMIKVPKTNIVDETIEHLLLENAKIKATLDELEERILRDKAELDRKKTEERNKRIIETYNKAATYRKEYYANKKEHKRKYYELHREEILRKKREQRQNEKAQKEVRNLMFCSVKYDKPNSNSSLPTESSVPIPHTHIDSSSSNKKQLAEQSDSPEELAKCDVNI